MKLTNELNQQLIELKKAIIADKKPTIKRAGSKGYHEFIAPLMSPLCQTFWRKLRNMEPMSRRALYKQKLWEIYNLFALGGFIRRNYSFGRNTIDIYSQNVRGLDQNGAYPYLLGASCLHPEPLEASQCDFERNKYVEWAVYEFDFKMKPKYKDIALFDIPGGKYVDYRTEGRYMQIGMPTAYWDFIQQLADFKLHAKTNVYYFRDLGSVMSKNMLDLYNKRVELTDAEKGILKLKQVAGIGFLALSPKEGNVRIPLINPIADYWVCARCQMRTLSMIKFIIDHGGTWIQSITDSVYWYNGPTYEEVARHFNIGNEFGSWKRCVDGNAYHFKTMTSGYYGIADKDGNTLLKRFSGLGEPSPSTAILQKYLETQPISVWDSVQNMKARDNNPPLLRAILNDIRSSTIDKLINRVQNGSKYFTTSNDKGEIVKNIIKNRNYGQKI